MESLELLGVKVSHQTVFNWIKKYVTLMKDYADRITPNVSDTWRADEIYIKVAGKRLIEAERWKPYDARCMHCGAIISSKKSLETGLGVVCRKKLGVKK